MKLLVGIWLFVVAIGSAAAADGQQDESQAMIEKAIDSYVAAFNARDAKQLTALWSPDGVYLSRISGDQIIGREALAADFSLLFEEMKEARLEVATESIEFISPNVALERGTATVLRPEEPPSTNRYRVVYVKKEGKWLIDRVTEEEEFEEEPSHYEQLKDLEWIIGNWTDQDGEISIETECQWTRNKNYMTRSFAVSSAGQVDMAGMQVIGWDPAAETIRSWTFDSVGGFTEGVWKQVEGRWVVHSTAILTDGTKGSSTSVLRPIDENSFGWQKASRIVDGEILQNIDEIVIVRSGSKQ